MLPHRNASGSETTSTRSSELDEEQRLADDDDASNRDISHDISNSSIDEEAEDRPTMNNTSGYVTLQSGSSPPNAMMGIPRQQPPYTHMGRGGWEPRTASPPGQPMFFGGADQLPPGYTKAVQAPVTLADPSRGYVATTFPAGPPQQELPVGRNLPDVG